MTIEIARQKSGKCLIFRSATTFGLLLLLILLPWLLFEDATEHFSTSMLAGTDVPVALAGTALLALDAFLPIPSSIVATAMGALLGGPLGTLVNAIGLTLGCLLGYLAGAIGRPVARRIFGVQAEAFESWIARYGIWALILCRAVPVLAEASVFALGAGRARLGPILAAGVLVDLSLGAVYAFAGAASESRVLPGAFAIAVATLVPAAATLVAWLFLRGFQRRRTNGTG